MIWLYAVRWRLVFISAVIATTALRMTSAVKASTLLILHPFQSASFASRRERLEQLQLLQPLERLPSNSFNRSSRQAVNASRAYRGYHLSPQLRGRLDIKLETTPLLLNHHAVVTSGRCQGYVPRAHVGEYALRRALKRVPKSAAAGGLDR